MAQIVLTEELGGFKWLGDFFSWDQTLDTFSDTQSHSTDNVTGSQIVLIGVGLQFKNGALTGGTVTGVQLLDSDDNLLVEVTGGSYGAKALKAGSFWEFVSALSAGNDTIIGADSGIDMNVMGQNRGDDTVIAGDGGSHMGGSAGKDVYTGGADWDTLSFQDSVWWDDVKHGITLNAAKSTVIDNWGDKDTFSNIEEYRASHFKDVLAGGSADEAFMGLEGADKINGGGGTDTLRYHVDAQYGGKKGIVADLGKGTVIDGFGDKDQVSNIENVFGTYKADKFVGDAEDNQFRGLSGKDSFSGGKGTDEVNFEWWEELGQHGADVDLSLSKNQIKDDGFGNTETTKGIESLGGSNFDDMFKLGKSNGWAWGADGDDTLVAGIGNQWFGGGEGADRFVFQAIASLGTEQDQDEIDDFSQTDGDVIDLSGIGGLIFKGTSDFSHTAGQLRYDQIDGATIVYGDTDGNGVADFQFKINLLVDLEETDFAL